MRVRPGVVTLVVVTLVAAALVVVAGCGGGPRPAAAPPADPARTSQLDRFRSVDSYQLPALPTSLRIPSIGVATRGVEHLGRLPDGTLEAPRGWQSVGWYDQGPRPGQVGPAVILGHVDSTAGPAVFYRLRNVRPGAAIVVGLADGTSSTFTVDRVVRYPKDAFPTDAVYFPTLQRTLRLITCGGSFDHAVGHYVDNIVVYATLT